MQVDAYSTARDFQPIRIMGKGGGGSVALSLIAKSLSLVLHVSCKKRRSQF